MILREPILPGGWYPRDKRLVSEFLDPFREKPASPAAPAVVAPHAGWFYSGFTAATAISALQGDAETVAVIGGHLPRGMPVLIAPEDGVKTPLGVMQIDGEFREKLEKKLEFRPDRYDDNTVEILLPMVHYFFPSSALLWLRFPAEISSFEAGKLLAETAGDLGRKIAVVASTDLTHYGDNYGYCPKGRGKAALEWVKKVNDAAFINAVLDGDPSRALKCAEEDYSACSAGAVLGALGFASASSPGKISKLLDYRTSADAGRSNDTPDSFVGYAAISLGLG